jgi:hypothetical protein
MRAGGWEERVRLQMGVGGKGAKNSFCCRYSDMGGIIGK